MRKVLPALLVGLSALLSGCVVGSGDETAGEQDTESAGVAQSPLNDHPVITDPSLPGDPGASEDPEPDPWKGGRVHDNTDPEPDPWHPSMAAVGSGTGNNKP
ncbi:MAG: hypothetical protein ABI193_19295 [Minicystis sp.]